MHNTLYQNDILSIKDLSLKEINLVLDLATQLKKQARSQTHRHLLANKIIAHCFFEPSTRTRLSFEAATLSLGGNVIGFSNAENLSVKKGETLTDTVRMLASYADLIIMRHPKDGAARLCAEIASIPLINAGDGANQHPTQTLVDLFTIKECQGGLENLHIALVGDLRHGRAIHSLAQGCSLIGARLYLVAAQNLSLSKTLTDELKKNSVKFSFHQSIAEVIPKVDILYMTRIQKERFFYQDEGKASELILRAASLAPAKKNLKVLHPLPRNDEIDVSVDTTPFAYYFEQAKNALYVREALLALIMKQEVLL